jgi:hypothetical protein
MARTKTAISRKVETVQEMVYGGAAAPRRSSCGRIWSERQGIAEGLPPPPPALSVIG